MRQSPPLHHLLRYAASVTPFSPPKGDRALLLALGVSPFIQQRPQIVASEVQFSGIWVRLSSVRTCALFPGYENVPPPVCFLVAGWPLLVTRGHYCPSNSVSVSIEFQLSSDNCCFQEHLYLVEMAHINTRLHLWFIAFKPGSFFLTLSVKCLYPEPRKTSFCWSPCSQVLIQ